MEQDKYITQFSTYLFWDVKIRKNKEHAKAKNNGVF